MSDLNKKEPQPLKNKSIYVWDLVRSDMQQPDHIGENRYGTRPQPNNGRDVLVDAYQESLGRTLCLRQAIYERDGE